MTWTEAKAAAAALACGAWDDIRRHGPTAADTHACTNAQTRADALKEYDGQIVWVDEDESWPIACALQDHDKNAPHGCGYGADDCGAWTLYTLDGGGAIAVGHGAPLGTPLDLSSAADAIRNARKTHHTEWNPRWLTLFPLAAQVLRIARETLEKRTRAAAAVEHGETISAAELAALVA